MPQYLITGGVRNPFLPRLLTAIRHANRIDLAVAFIKSSGLTLLFDALADAIETRGAQLRILTSDYLDVTDPPALRRLLLLAERGADVRVFQAEDESFHLKAYICVQNQEGREVWGAAFVGSSNISRTALTDGLEWNYRVNWADDPAASHALGFREIQVECQVLFEHPNVHALDHDWIDRYEQRRKVQRLPVAPGSNDQEDPPPWPTEVQREALAALAATRDAGYRRGLVVMATGLGKTYLAAFDSASMHASSVLFVAHREEILLQAEGSFQRVHPRRRVGRYTGEQKDADVDLLFASVQTLGQVRHLERFEPERFEYIVVDEFHHASAPIYRQLLQHFRPRFLLGLTATPERTDQSDILSLCDDNLVYTRHLFDGIELGLLCPFHYYGIYDETVNYQEIPWRNGRFDPESLSNKLATLGRARHALTHWRAKAQGRTLAFCVSKRHADFMAARFRREGIRAAAVYHGSPLDRSAALEQLDRGELQVICSVDLFNEGVDLPAIDTVLMLRPTESKVLFLQQLGRGLRQHPDKERLVVLDFIGNHKGFLNKPQALFGAGTSYSALAAFARRARDGTLILPPGCYANYDIEIIEFLTRLQGRGPATDYQSLKESLGRRPTLAEFYRSGSSIADLRRLHSQWWALVRDQGDLAPAESACLLSHEAFFREVETTNMTRSYKAVLLESLLDNDGLRDPPRLEDLAVQALTVFRRRRSFVSDLPSALRDLDSIDPGGWLGHWKRNPINAWTGSNKSGNATNWFVVRKGRFQPNFDVPDAEIQTFQSMVRELVDYRLAAYEPRLDRPAEPAEANEPTVPSAKVIPFRRPTPAPETTGRTIPYFPNLRIACGHFRSGRTDVDATCRIGSEYGRLDPSRHFVARAIGNSMNGGRTPVQDGDYLLLELLDPAHAGSITGQVMVVERQDAGGDDQYLLRLVTKTPDGRYILKATNPEYPDYEADESMRTLARLRVVLSPENLTFIGDADIRSDPG
ncbi:DEAD/DEAH box helicase family protein [Candidatus Thiodictyon syntrophicum]|uniref:DEAD/DEAH box helicase family protein n=1 Tax=Candidatus Thiodictyon syntrophicum TaxID=1166950 RepID=UPI000C2D64B3|nr:DEAD/DEAH box helicase family protein [Candidatus Thiodictyon syntrophicum]